MHVLRDPARASQTGRMEYVTAGAGPDYVAGEFLTATGKFTFPPRTRAGKVTHGTDPLVQLLRHGPTCAHTAARLTRPPDLTPGHPFTNRHTPPFWFLFLRDPLLAPLRSFASSIRIADTARPSSPLFENLHTLRVFHPFTHPAYS